MVKNGDMTLLLLELILADLPPVVASSGKKWQFHISTVRAHIGRSTGRSTPQYWCIVVKNGNMRLLLKELILADQLASTLRAHVGRSTGRSTPPLYWYLVVKNGNMTFLL